MYKIIPASLEHVDEIYEIEQESFSDPWSKSSIIYEIEHKFSICLSAVDTNGNVLGYAAMRWVINEGHINNIAVLPSYRGQGIGGILIEGLIKEAKARDMIGLTLEVRAGNAAAISMYEKYGFITEGIRKNYYFSPTEDALIMWKMMQDKEKI